MKKLTIIAAVILFGLSLAPSAALPADIHDDDADVIKRAVKSNPYYQKGKEVKWFKLEVTNTVTDKVEVKITLPISLFEIILESSRDRDMRIDRDDLDLDLKELFQSLKKAGPMSIIEIYDEEDGHEVKIWLE
jgi:hypothetical protein